jgi:hypothetical protein
MHTVNKRTFMSIQKHQTRCWLVPMLLAYSTVGQAETLGWSEQDELAPFSAQTHHWGQKGQTTPNNGWSNYGVLELDMGGPDRIALYQNKDELLAKIIDKETNEEKARAFSIQRAGIFYHPKSMNTCEPDTIERVGIYAELALNFVANAYPKGPDKALPIETKTVKGPSTNVRFMQALIENKKPWSVSVEVKQSAPGEHTLEINDQINPKTKKMTMHWISTQGQEIPSSNAKIADWQACWLGTQPYNPKTKTSTTKLRIPNADQLSTFGELRAKLKEVNSSVKK